MDIVRSFIAQPFLCHLIVGTIIRLALIKYGNFHDDKFDVPYTDVDYKVFSDAGRHVYNGYSPYKRHTYRYSPFIAFLMVPNIFWKDFGKVLFCLFDILITLAVKILVEHQLDKNQNSKVIAKYCTLLWLYNPISIAISTRGNGDSIPCFFIIMSLLFLHSDVAKSSAKYVYSGILLGISIHLRLYPLAFSFPMYLSLRKFEKRHYSFMEALRFIMLPNKKQLALVSSCVSTLITLTCCMYFLYGYEFLFETYLYHLFRKDTKHNFSIFFYYSYLTMDKIKFDGLKAISRSLEFLILFGLSLTFGSSSKTLPFALFCQTVVLVTYNSVMTSQYFVWFLSLLPLVAHSFDATRKEVLAWFVIWILPQSLWLLYAYKLEFKGQEVFTSIWFSSLLLYTGNIYVLGKLINTYKPGFGFGITDVKTSSKHEKQS